MMDLTNGVGTENIPCNACGLVARRSEGWKSYCEACVDSAKSDFAETDGRSLHEDEYDEEILNTLRAWSLQIDSLRCAYCGEAGCESHDQVVSWTEDAS